jgi:hypothetical protein
VDDCKNLSDHEALIRLISATAQNLFVEFTENKLLYLCVDDFDNLSASTTTLHQCFPLQLCCSTTAAPACRRKKTHRVATVGFKVF